MEKNVPGSVRKGKENSQENGSIQFYNVARLLYLETGTSSISLGARLLQVRNGMNCGCDTIPDNAILHLIAFASKNPSSLEWH